jgi:hypothetical protein
MYNCQNYFYYLYLITSNGLILKETFSSYNDLIYFLASNQRGEKEIFDKKLCYNNVYLDEINLTLNDCYSSINNNGEKVYYIRPYVFFNQDLSIVDTRSFYNDIIKAKEELSNKRYYNSYLEKRYKGHIFRQNPVPYTGKRRANSCRNVKYGRIIRDLRNPENKDFIRKKRYYDILEPYFDLPYKKETKSWKEQTKRRHQWEKHG